MFIIGLTGGLATGKSTVLGFFKENGIAVIDADQIAREIVEPGQKSWDLIVREFGTGVIADDGKINRAALGELVFDDVDKRRRLNAITHPRIQSTLVKMAAVRFFQGHPFIVMELPLLFESGRMMSLMYKIITVVCDDTQQLERLCQRNSFTEEIAKKRIATQMPLEEKVNHSQFVVNNCGSLDDTRRQTENIIKILRQSYFHWYIRGAIGGAILSVTCISWYIWRKTTIFV